MEEFAENITAAQTRLTRLQMHTDHDISAPLELPITLAELSTMLQKLSDDANETMAQQLLLQHDKEQFAQFFRHAPESYIITTFDGIILEANTATEKLFQVSAPNLLGLALSDLLDPVDKERIHEQVRSLQQTGVIQRWSTRIVRPNLDKIEVMCSFQLIANLDEAVLGWIFIDATELRRVEALLQSSMRFLHLLSYSAPDVLMIYDLTEHRIVFLSESIRRVLGYSPDAIIQNGTLIADFVHPNDRIDAHGAFKRLIMAEDGETIETLFRIQHANGSWRWLDCRQTLILPDAPDGTRQMIGVYQDVTERMEAEHNLTERNRELAALNAIGSAISSTLELSSLFATLQPLLAEHLAITGAVFMTHSAEHDQPSMMAAWELDDALLAFLRGLPLGADEDGWEAVYTNSATFPIRRRLALAEVLASRQFARWRSSISLSLYVDGKIQVIVDLFSERAENFTSSGTMFWETLGQQLGVAIHNARLFEEVRAAQERLRALSRRLVEVHEVERRYVARELHDEIGQSLTGLKLVLETRLPIAGEAQTEALALVNGLIGRVRNMSLDLRPAMLDDLGLKSALMWLLDRYTTQTQLSVNFRCSGLDRRFESEIETAAYRIVQEGLTNVARHAHSTDVTVRLWASKRSLYIQIDDNGVGFEVETVRAAGRSSGLAGMQERVTLLGGDLDIESVVGAGTCLTAEIPFGEDTGTTATLTDQ